MKNFIQEGRTLTVSAPRAVESGDGVLVGLLFGVAAFDSDSADEVEIDTVGVFDLAKATGAAWAVGDPIYWDDSAYNATRTATGNVLIGVATAAAESGDTTGNVRIGYPIATTDPEVSSV